MQRLLRVTALVLIGLGFVVLVSPGTVLTGLTRLALPAAAVDSPQWIALAFARLAAASFIATGGLLLVVRRLVPPLPAPMVAGTIAGSLAVVAIVAATQAVALFGTPASWALAGVLGAFALGFAAMGLRARAA